MLTPKVTGGVQGYAAQVPVHPPPGAAGSSVRPRGLHVVLRPSCVLGMANTVPGKDGCHPGLELWLRRTPRRQPCGQRRQTPREDAMGRGGRKTGFASTASKPPGVGRAAQAGLFRSSRKGPTPPKSLISDVWSPEV
uniref:Uncharacterized protein n=1 Tax=Myotis myotis TaxID=51298 RepID=A0A7J7RHF9_MYOMY|nr:hypothetical protein mMyoMyo1_010305 [Myotis myotis]